MRQKSGSRMEFGDIGACPEEVHMCPTPAYDLWCGYVHKGVGDDSVGFEFDLEEINGGWFGTKTNVTIDGKQRILYCQPCERKLCPLQYMWSISNPNHSSVWLCRQRRRRARVTVSAPTASTSDSLTRIICPRTWF
jgi:hypothetical protein